MTWDSPARSDKVSSDTRPALTDITPSPDKRPEASDIRVMVCDTEPKASADTAASDSHATVCGTGPKASADIPAYGIVARSCKPASHMDVEVSADTMASVADIPPKLPAHSP